jgi:squalene-hopene/tetraprenyl-beta-curcumene cyclase
MPRTAQKATKKIEFIGEIEAVLADSLDSFKKHQRDDGHWVFELEADVSIPAEYIMLNHYLDLREPELEAELADYIRSIQNDDGGWPLFYGGDSVVSGTVKAYYALKLVGDDPDAPHMKNARQVVLDLGGAETANVFTRYALALFEQVPWRAAPAMPIELMLLPKWFPVTMWRFSYWSRTVIAPFLVLRTLRPKAANPRQVGVVELFKTPPFEIPSFNLRRTHSIWEGLFFGLDKVLRYIEPHFPKSIRKRALRKATTFFAERANGLDGLGAIFPAMANTVMALRAMGLPDNHPQFQIALLAVRRLISWERKPRFVQPCTSPIWDTGLGSLALLEAGEAPDGKALKPAFEWLRSKQILDVEGDWIVRRPGLEPGGWAFQYKNDHYPDVDDTAVVAMALHRADQPQYKEAVARAEKWIVGMQSRNGGWGAFDAENNNSYLNYIPFADHGALLDPPTEDVTARCLSFLAQIGYAPDHPVIERGHKFLIDAQQEDGSWFGRWGTNYVYGTWSVLCALNKIGEDPAAPYIRRAVEWLVACQGEDGGWGEDGATYWQEKSVPGMASTASQTAWAVLGLMAAGEVGHPAVERGITHLAKAERDGDKWYEPWHTAVGFPRVFYLRYDGYSRYFPIWALARYRDLKAGNSRQTQWGM